MTLSSAVQITERIAGALCLLAVGSAAWYGAVKVAQAMDGLSATTVQLQTTTAKLNATMDAINAPCTGFHGSVTCGPLAQLSQTIKNIGILSGQATEQVKQSALLVNVTTESLRNTSGKVTEMADAFVRTADAGTGTLNAATKTLGIVNDPKTGLAPTLAAYTGLGEDMDKMLKGKAVQGVIDELQATLTGMAGMAANGNAISGDIHHWEQPFMNPVPCKMTKHPERCKWARIGKGIGTATIFAGRAGQAALPVVMR